MDLPEALIPSSAGGYDYPCGDYNGRGCGKKEYGDGSKEYCDIHIVTGPRDTNRQIGQEERDWIFRRRSGTFVGCDHQMFEHDHSAARGKMAVRKLIIFKHSKELGDCRLINCLTQWK